MKIGVDLDGVCYDFSEDARRVISEWRRVHPSSLEEVRVWDFPHKQWGIPMDLFWEIWFHDVREGSAWNSVDPIAGTVEGLQALRDRGHTIHIITSRHGGEVPTVEWINRHEIPHDSLHIARDKTIVSVDVLVDDWERNWSDVTNSGGRCLLWDQPWNWHVEGAERVRSWDDVIEKLGG